MNLFKNNLTSVKSLFLNIRFWIIIFFIIRLIGITNPPLETSHNWRQTTVTMVARNFLEVDNNIMYPRVDFAGDKTGITGMEFPIFNYLIYLVSEIFGYSHWYGRLINLIFSSFGIFFFYKLIKKYFTHQIAFNASIILMCSLWFSFSRKIMPDTFSMSFIISCIYFGTNYLEGKSFKNLFFYTLLLAVGSLSKLPSAYLLIVFLIFFIDKKISTKKKLFFSMVSILTLTPTILWYFYWFPDLVNRFQFWHFSMGKSLTVGASEIFNEIPLAFQRFYADALKYIGFIVFILGIIQAFIKKQNKLLAILLLSLFGYLIIIFKAGYVFTHHNYYIIPFIPIMALIAGFGLTQFKNKKIGLIILALIVIENISNQQHDFFLHEKEMALLNLEPDLDKISNKKDLILINSGDYPTPMYFAHRKGWVLNNNKIKDKKKLLFLKEKGLKWVVILKRKFGSEINLELPVVINNNDYTIYQLF